MIQRDPSLNMEQTKKDRRKKTALKGLRIPEGYNSRFAIKGHHKETAGGGEVILVMLGVHKSLV